MSSDQIVTKTVSYFAADDTRVGFTPLFSLSFAFLRQPYPVSLVFSRELAWASLSNVVADLFWQFGFALVTALPISGKHPLAVLQSLNKVGLLGIFYVHKPIIRPRLTCC